MRTYKTILDALNETSRDLKVRSITTICKSYQDKKLEGENQKVKELIGVEFCITNPLLKRDSAIEYMFKDKEESKKIIEYCKQEIKDRCSGSPLNPGNSYKIRKDMWQKFLEDSGKFSYQYAERLWTNDQFNSVVKCLINDSGTRQAVLSVWNSDKDMNVSKTGGGNRIPCSLNYQFFIRNNELHCIYSMRSNDFFGHHVIDLYCASGLMEYIVDRIKCIYPGLKVGSLIYSCGSLHAFAWDIDKWVLF